MKSKISVLTMFGFLLLVAILVMSGCGGATTPTPTKPAPAPATTAPPAPAPAAPKPSPAATTPAPAPAPAPSPAAPPAKVKELKLGHWGNPAQEAQYDAFKKEVEQKTNGQIKVNIFGKSALGNFNTHMDLLLSGGVDLAMYMPVYFPGKYPLSDMFSLPFIFSDLKAHTLAMDELVKRGLLDKVYQEVHHVSSASSPPSHMMTKKVKVKVPADLKGLKVRGVGGTSTAALEKAGAAAVTVPYAEVYSAFEKGVVDAAIAGYDVSAAMKLDEFVRNVTEINAIGTVMFLAMNKKSYESLSPAFQKIIDEAGFNSIQPMLNYYNDVLIKQGRDSLIKKGADIYTPTDAEMKQWRDAFKLVWDDWFKTTETKGLAGKQLMHEYGVAVKKLGGQWAYDY